MTQIKWAFAIKLHELCNEKCSFCFQDNETRHKKFWFEDEKIFQIINYAFKQWYKIIYFTWWEPLIHKSIIKFIKFSKKIWFEYIYIQTNWVLLSDYDFAKKCYDSWATMFHISLHHSDSKIHDELVNLPWAYDKVLKWILNLQKLWAYLWIHIVLNKKNYKDISDIVKFIFWKGIINITILFPIIQWSIIKNYNEVWITYNEVIPYIKDTFSLYWNLTWKYLYVINIPPCLIKWYEKYIITWINSVLLELNWKKIIYFDEKSTSNYYINHCSSCDYRKKCPWVDKAYLDINWDEKFLDLVLSLENKNTNNVQDNNFVSFIPRSNFYNNYLSNLILSNQFSISQNMPITWFDELNLFNKQNVYKEIFL